MDKISGFSGSAALKTVLIFYWTSPMDSETLPDITVSNCSQCWSFFLVLLSDILYVTMSGLQLMPSVSYHFIKDVFVLLIEGNARSAQVFSEWQLNCIYITLFLSR